MSHKGIHLQIQIIRGHGSQLISGAVGTLSGSDHSQESEHSHQDEQQKILQQKAAAGSFQSAHPHPSSAGPRPLDRTRRRLILSFFLLYRWNAASARKIPPFLPAAPPAVQCRAAQRLPHAPHEAKTQGRFSALPPEKRPCSDVVRLKGLEPTRIAAREPKGDVTLVKHFFSALLFFTLFHLLLKCLFQHFPPRLLGQGILIQLAHFYRLANLNIGFAKGERDHTRCTGRDSSANY